MKRQTAIGTLALFLLLTLVGCLNNNSGNSDVTSSNNGNSNDIERVYLLSGRNELFVIKNGSIVITSKLELFVGGELNFYEIERSQNIKSYTAKSYFYLDGVETVINSITNSIENSEVGIDIAPDMGTTSAERIFNPDIWNIIIEPGALHFSLSGTYINGETFEYSIILNVDEA
jgi:hypothetical protein